MDLDSDEIPDILDLDEDNDGLPDYWEINYFGDLSEGPEDNYDNDGYSNLDEYDRRTNPTILNVLLRTIRLMLVLVIRG